MNPAAGTEPEGADQPEPGWGVAQCVGLCGAWTDGSQFCRKTYCSNPGAALEDVHDMTTSPPTVVARRAQDTAALYPADFDEDTEAFEQDALGWVRFDRNGIEYRANAMAGHALRVR